MRVSKRSTKDGIYYSFLYTDEKTGQVTRLPKTSHPHFDDYDKAVEWAKSQTAYREAMKTKIAAKLAWKTKFYDFNELVELYRKYKQESAPNSIDRYVKNLTYYIFPFFLLNKKLSNINEWHWFIQEFLDWLKDGAKTMKGDRKPSYSSMNHIITTFNTFLECLSRYNKIDKDSVKTCPMFGADKLPMKGYDCVVQEPEFKKVYSDLLKIDTQIARFYYLLYFTGMRLNELYSLPMTAIHQEEISPEIHAELTQHKIEYWGYIMLESQCRGKRIERDPITFEVRRKPLKGRKDISEKNSRLIPIIDKSAWNILIDLYEGQKRQYLKNVYGQDQDQYLLFDGFSRSKAARELTKIYHSMGKPVKLFHNLRHTLATWLVGKTHSYFLVRAILGHKTSAYERYVHIWEAMSRKSRQNTLELKRVI